MDPPPPDPYLVLGLPRDAEQAAIKTAYRKLALKYHPDKAKDKADEFCKVQSAYELIGSDESRGKYDAEYKLNQLRQDAQRQWYPGAQAGGVGVRTTSFDMRTSPHPNFPFSARTPPRYETQERRPSATFTTPGTPRATSYHYEQSDYFGTQASSRSRHDPYDVPPPTRRASHSTRSPREDDRRSEAKREKASSTAKVRNDTKKQRDKERGHDRRSKVSSVASLPSDDDETTYTSRRSYSDLPRDAYIRKNSLKRSDDELSDRHTRVYEDPRKTDARDYIYSSRKSGAPVEKISTPISSYAPPPTASRRGSREDALPETRSSKSRPEPVRRSSARLDKRAPETTSRSRPSISRRTTSRRSPSPESVSERRVPAMPTSKSSPANLKIPSPDLYPRRSRTSDDHLTEEERGPTYRRSETAPLKSSPRVGVRREDSTPFSPSGLRHSDTQIPNDSGYSTGNSPDDATSGRARDSKTYRHSPEQDSKPFLSDEERYFNRSPSPARDRERDRERDLPIRERSRDRATPGRDRDSDRERTPISNKERDRVKAPPVSRSASYAAEKVQAARVSESDRTPPASRRSSIQREGSIREESRERPSLDRSSSTRGSSRKVPALDRGMSAPLPTSVRTGTRKTQLFGEIDSDDIEEQRTRRGSPLSGRPSARYFDAADDSHGPPTSYGSRRGSEDVGRKSMDHVSNYTRDYRTKDESRRQEGYV